MARGAACRSETFPGAVVRNSLASESSAAIFDSHVSLQLGDGPHLSRRFGCFQVRSSFRSEIALLDEDPMASRENLMTESREKLAAAQASLRRYVQTGGKQDSALYRRFVRDLQYAARGLFDLKGVGTTAPR